MRPTKKPMTGAHTMDSGWRLQRAGPGFPSSSRGSTTTACGFPRMPKAKLCGGLKPFRGTEAHHRALWSNHTSPSSRKLLRSLYLTPATSHTGSLSRPPVELAQRMERSTLKSFSKLLPTTPLLFLIKKKLWNFLFLSCIAQHARS